ncbi:hypothetical protein EJB05_22887, partial [Eragrostis curvula]
MAALYFDVSNKIRVGNLPRALGSAPLRPPPPPPTSLLSTCPSPPPLPPSKSSSRCGSTDPALPGTSRRGRARAPCGVRSSATKRATDPTRSRRPSKLPPDLLRLDRAVRSFPVSGRHVQALSVNNRRRGYLTNYGQPINLVFRLQDPKPVVYMKGNVQVTVKPKGRKRHWDYQRSRAIKSREGHVMAQGNVGVGKASVLALQILGEGIRLKLEETKVLVAMEKICAMQQCGEVKLVGVGCGCPPGGAVGVRQGIQDAEGRGQCRVDVVASVRLPLSWKEKQQQ